MSENNNYISMRLTGLILNGISSLGKYGSLVFGIYSVVREREITPESLIAGLAYGVFSTLGFIGDVCNSLSFIDELREKDIGRLEDLIKERRVPGRSLRSGKSTLDKLTEDDIRRSESDDLERESDDLEREIKEKRKKA